MNNMNKKEHIASILEGMGYKPQYDDDGDIFIMYQMKNIFFLFNEDEQENFISLTYPQFVEIEEGEESLSLAICNKMTREIKQVKVCVDKSFKSISANSEFFYANDEALEYSIKMSLRMLGVMRSQYYLTREELLE